MSNVSSQLDHRFDQSIATLDSTELRSGVALISLPIGRQKLANVSMVEILTRPY